MATPYATEMGSIPQQPGGAPPVYGGSGPQPQNQPMMQAQPQPQYPPQSMGYSQQQPYYDQSKGPMSPPPQMQQYQPGMQPQYVQPGMQMQPQMQPQAVNQPVTNVININNGAPQTAVVPIVHACVNGHTPYTPVPITGILWAVLCFPIGLICLFSEMQTRCSTCGALL